MSDERRPGVRWVTYQRERFPLAAHAPLVLAFSAAAVCFSALLRAPDARPAPRALAAAFASALLAFFQLRVSDEFKDAAEDARFRPYRPVPRGLVTLGELRALALAGGAVQAALAVWVDPRLLAPLALLWAYMALMQREFFVPEWLHRRPLATILTHMPVVPLIDLYASAFDWLPHRAGHVGGGLGWFLGASYANGVVVEVGRKIRARPDEERGVVTYSRRWGRPRAVAALLLALVATLVCAAAAARRTGHAALLLAVLAPLAAAGGVVGSRFLARGTRAHARWFEPLSGAWTLALYLTLGAVPMLLRIWRGST